MSTSVFFFRKSLSGTKNLSLVRGVDKSIGIFKNETFGMLSEALYEIRAFLSLKYRLSFSHY